jgi:flagellar basal-body rod protein FlgB
MEIFDPIQLDLTAAIRGASVRQEALSQNIANANVPGYRRKDVDFHAALNAAMAGGQDPDQIQFNVQEDPSAPMRADGNSVDMDAESAKLSENGLEYEALVSVARGRIDIIDAAMGRG